jgi:hypothetical protein
MPEKMLAGRSRSTPCPPRGHGHWCSAPTWHSIHWRATSPTASATRPAAAASTTPSTSPGGAARDQAMTVLAPAGALVLVGLTPEPLTIARSPAFCTRGNRLLGHYGSTPRHVEELVEMAGSHRLDFTRSVSDHIPLADAEKAVHRLATRPATPSASCWCLDRPPTPPGSRQSPLSPTAAPSPPARSVRALHVRR